MSKRSVKLEPSAVIAMLTGEVPDRRPALKVLSKVAVPTIVAAIKSADSSSVRGVLCDVLGFRHAAGAVPVLIEMLDDLDPSVRSSAADALAKIRDPAAGPALQRQFKYEVSSPVRSMLAAALGAVGHAPSIPLLIKSLSAPWDAVRGARAWS
jgi:HEAT repeat protein